MNESNNKVVTKSSDKPVRQSNFELLRILAIFGIVLYHIVLLGVMNNAFQARTSLYATPHFFPSLAIFPLIAIFGHMGNNIFILLSGYFLFGKNINFTSQTKKILAQIAFATLTLIFISFYHA